MLYNPCSSFIENLNIKLYSMVVYFYASQNAKILVNKMFYSNTIDKGDKFGFSLDFITLHG